MFEALDLDSRYFEADSQGGKIEALGFGCWVQGEAQYLPRMFGRQDELKRHLRLLRYAVEQERPYLLSGDKGVGKSLFLMHLIRQTFAGSDHGKKVALFRPDERNAC